MNLKFQELQVNPDDPFGNDLLDRQKEIDNLSTLLQNLNSPAVLAINSPWGTGKTTFVKMWEAYLQKQKVGTLYFNAWKTDFSEDPLVSFLGEINEGLSELVGTSKKSKEAWSKTKAIGKQIAKRGLPALIKIGTVGIIDTAEIVEEELSKVMEGLTGDALDQYLQQKSAISDFHAALSELVQLSPGENPVVIFVDELDRCRPTYAITLLERIKHLFDIEGLIFVLSLDKTQLCHSIRAVYGAGIDAEAYLRRFIDFEYQLSRPEMGAYLDSLFGALRLDDYFNKRRKFRELQYEKDHLLKVILELSTLQRLSLREIEQLLAGINLALRTAKKNEFVYPALLTFLMVTKEKRPDIYQSFISPNVPETEIIEYLYEIFPVEDGSRSFECALIEGLIIAAKIDSSSGSIPDALSRHREIFDDEQRPRRERSYSESVIHIASKPGGMRGGIDISKLAERIGMLSQFQFADYQEDS